MKRIGPTFGDEIRAAGLAGLPFAWGDDGQLNLDDPRLTAEQRAAIEAVLAAHDPGARLPDPTLRQLRPFDFRQRFSRDQRIAFDSSTDPDVVDLRGAFYAADSVGLDDTRTIAGLHLLVAKGIIVAVGGKTTDEIVAALRADRRPEERPGR